MESILYIIKINDHHALYIKTYFWENAEQENYFIILIFLMNNSSPFKIEEKLFASYKNIYNFLATFDHKSLLYPLFLYFQANLHELHIYTRYLAGVRNFLARKFKKYEKRARRKRYRLAKVSLDNLVTFRCCWGMFTACGLTNPLSFLHLSHHSRSS